jgi:hypothetical protein
MKEGRKRMERRTLLKASGLVAASGALGSLWALVAGAGNSANARRRARWIRVVDRPTLGETTADYKRFSGNDIFSIYRQLKDQHDGAGSFEAEQTSKAKRLAAWISEKKPGYSLPDRQLSEGAFTVMHSAKPGSGLLAWTRTSVRTTEEMVTPRYTASPEDMANTVKAAARLYGAGLVGIAPMNEAYVNLLVPHREQPRKDSPDKDTSQKTQHPLVQRQEGGHSSGEHSTALHRDSQHPDVHGKDQPQATQPPQDKEIVFEDTDVPAVTDTKFVIPRKMKWVVAIAIPMDLDLLSRAPTALGDTAAALGYSHSAFVVASLAVFIRGLGYEAIPCVNDTAQSIPFAVDAGIGELRAYP